MNQHVGKRFINRSGKTAEVQPTITKADAGPVTGGVCVDVKPLAAAEIRVGGNGSMCGHCGMGPYATLLEAYTHVTSVHTMLPGKPPGLCVETGCLKGQSLPYTLCDAHLVAKGFRPAPALPFSESIARRPCQPWCGKPWQGGDIEAAWPRGDLIYCSAECLQLAIVAEEYMSQSDDDSQMSLAKPACSLGAACTHHNPRKVEPWRPSVDEYDLLPDA